MLFLAVCMCKITAKILWELSLSILPFLFVMNGFQTLVCYTNVQGSYPRNLIFYLLFLACLKSLWLPLTYFFLRKPIFRPLFPIQKICISLKKKNGLKILIFSSPFSNPDFLIFQLFPHLFPHNLQGNRKYGYLRILFFLL